MKGVSFVVKSFIDATEPWIDLTPVYSSKVNWTKKAICKKCILQIPINRSGFICSRERECIAMSLVMQSRYNVLVKRGFFVRWFRQHGRHFPWRDPHVTPYQILVTEILLHQTKAEDVSKLWRNFFEIFPNLEALAAAKQKPLLSLISHLGFGNWRSRALQIVAQKIRHTYKGLVPNNLGELLDIPYVGRYTGNAVLSFAFDKRVEIVDTNVLRLFSRYFGLLLKPDIRRSKEPWEIARNLLPSDRGKTKMHNYGLLDFTAQICKPRRPLCEICPLIKTCSFGSRFDKLGKHPNGVLK